MTTLHKNPNLPSRSVADDPRWSRLSRETRQPTDTFDTRFRPQTSIAGRRAPRALPIPRTFSSTTASKAQRPRGSALASGASRTELRSKPRMRSWSQRHAGLLRRARKTSRWNNWQMRSVAARAIFIAHSKRSPHGRQKPMPSAPARRKSAKVWPRATPSQKRSMTQASIPATASMRGQRTCWV
jgi:hypothetical protein